MKKSTKHIYEECHKAFIYQRGAVNNPAVRRGVGLYCWNNEDYNTVCTLYKPKFEQASRDRRAGLLKLYDLAETRAARKRIDETIATFDEFYKSNLKHLTTVNEKGQHVKQSNI